LLINTIINSLFKCYSPLALLAYGVSGQSEYQKLRSTFRAGLQEAHTVRARSLAVCLPMTARQPGHDERQSNDTRRTIAAVG
jgi:hypothetical protein